MGRNEELEWPLALVVQGRRVNAGRPPDVGRGAAACGARRHLDGVRYGAAWPLGRAASGAHCRGAAPVLTVDHYSLEPLLSRPML